MPIEFEKHDNKPTCSLDQWSIDDVDELAKVLAWLYVRKPKHAAKIIAKLAPGSASFPGREFAAARALLTYRTNDIEKALKSADATIRLAAEEKRDTRIEHRDGLLFQHISWVAASIRYPNSHLSPPHVRTADKGFDGVLIRINSTTSLGSVTLCEDKATTNPRNLVTQSIWKEITSIHNGDKDLEIHDAVTALLEKADGVDVELALQGISWENLRRYRIALTAPETKKKNDSFAHIFKGFDKVALGKIITRKAEFIALPDVRAFLDDLAQRVIAELNALESNFNV